MVWPCFKSSGLAKTTLQGTVKGKRKRDIQKKCWEDNIKNGQEWTLPAQLGQLQTGQDGKGLLRIHLWCPDDLLRLWDRIQYNRRYHFYTSLTKKDNSLVKCCFYVCS